MIKPSEVDLRWPHFVACAGRSERECALGLYVRACQVNGDIWQAMIPRDIGQVLKADHEAKREPFASLAGNPFWFPDFHDLVRAGFAKWGGEGDGAPVELTERGFAAIEKWAQFCTLRRESAPNGGPA